MKCYKIIVTNNLDEFTSAEVVDFDRSLAASCSTEYIENTDLALFCIMIMSLVENVEVQNVSLHKSDDQEDYIWKIDYKEDGGIYHTYVAAERKEDDLGTSFIGKIQSELRDYGIREVLGMNYIEKQKFEHHAEE